MQHAHFSIYAPTYLTFWRVVLFENLKLAQLHSFIEYTIYFRFHGSFPLQYILSQGCAVPWSQIARENKCCETVSNILGSSVWNFLYVTILVPRIFRRP
jgi:hypothetical protein